jgi:hypothetical protein
MVFVNNVPDNEEVIDTTDIHDGTDIPDETIDLTMLESDEEDEDIQTTFFPDPIESNSAYIARLSALAARDAITDTVAVHDATETLNERRNQQAIVSARIQRIDVAVNTIVHARRDAAGLLHQGRSVHDPSMVLEALRMREAAEAAADVTRENIQRTDTILQALGDSPPPALVSEPVTQAEIVETLRANDELRAAYRIRKEKYETQKQATKPAPNMLRNPRRNILGNQPRNQLQNLLQPVNQLRNLLQPVNPHRNQHLLQPVNPHRNQHLLQPVNPHRNQLQNSTKTTKTIANQQRNPHPTRHQHRKLFLQKIQKPTTRITKNSGGNKKRKTYARSR